jgi:hypothetical protein
MNAASATALVEMPIVSDESISTGYVHGIQRPVRELAPWTRAPQRSTVDDSAATRSRLHVERVKARVTELVRKHRDEIFESGMDSALGRSSQRLFRQEPNWVTAAISDLIVARTISEEGICEMLRAIARIPNVEPRQRELMNWALQSPSAKLRDAAILGLAQMEDTRSLPMLERAIRTERLPELKRDMERLVALLTPRP